MQQPSFPMASSTPATPPAKENQIRKPPTPKDMIAMYESKGMETQEAAIKVIDDLQGMLFRMASTRRAKKEKFIAETTKKLDIVNMRLGMLEKKIDSKPGIGKSFLVGVAAGGALNGLGSVWVHVASGIGEIWNSVRRVTKSSSSA